MEIDGCGPNDSVCTVDVNELSKKSIKDRVAEGSLDLLLLCPQGLDSKPLQLKKKIKPRQ